MDHRIQVSTLPLLIQKWRKDKSAPDIACPSLQVNLSATKFCLRIEVTDSSSKGTNQSPLPTYFSRKETNFILSSRCDKHHIQHDTCPFSLSLSFHLPSMAWSPCLPKPLYCPPFCPYQLDLANTPFTTAGCCSATNDKGGLFLGRKS